MLRCIWPLVFAASCLVLQGCSIDLPRPTKIESKSRGMSSHRPAPGSKSPQWSSGQLVTNTVAAISGEHGDPYSRLIVDLTGLLGRNQLRLRPVASRGPRQDLIDLLNEPEIDAAIVQADALEACETGVQTAAREQLRYLFRAPNLELHVVAPLAITDLRQLEGRKVNIDQPDTGTHLTARLIFEKLGIKPDFTTYDQFTARNSLKSGEIEAAVVLASRPSGEVLVFPSQGFHLLPIPPDETLLNYTASQFTSHDYPHLVGAGKTVETIAVGRILVVRDRPKGSARYRHLARLTEALHGRFDELQQAGSHPGWRNIDPLKLEPGWQWFTPAQDIIRLKSKQAEKLHLPDRPVALSHAFAVVPE